MAGRWGAGSVREALGLPARFGPWLVGLDSLGAPPRPLVPTPPAEARELLGRLRVPSSEVDRLVGSIPTAENDPARWWLVERCYTQLARDMGGFDPLPPWPALADELGERGRFLYVYVFLATVPAVRQWHAERGISDEISWATLADLGNQMDIHRWMYGRSGLETHGWLTLHFRGGIYRLGRLQFNRSRIGPGPGQPPLFWYDAATVEQRGPGFRPGDHALGVHIPRGSPLATEACDSSLRRARGFFARHFPFEPCVLATCTSWLLDDQLAEYLSKDSNIVRFQRRFQIIPGAADGDEDVMRFVFGRAVPALEDLPQDTILQRAIVSHLRAGRHWRTRTGWLEL